MSQKPITQKPITQKPINNLQEFHNHHRFTRDYHALSGLKPSVYTYSVKCNLSYFILSNTSLLTITHTLIALVAIKVKSFNQNTLLRTY